MADDAPTAADTCPDCLHPWAKHDATGCKVWDDAPCTCRRAEPKGITLTWPFPLTAEADPDEAWLADGVVVFEDGTHVRFDPEAAYEPPRLDDDKGDAANEC